jgi:phage terminase small subunit
VGTRPAPSPKKKVAAPKEPVIPELDQHLDAEAEAVPVEQRGDVAGTDVLDELLARLPYRQQTFVAEYMANGGNATRAAIVAGYSQATADSQASRLLKDVKVAAVVDVWTASALSRRKVTAEGVLDELRKIAYRRPQKMFRPDGSLVPIAELDDDTAAAIEGIEVREITRDGCVIGHLKKIKLASKVNALELLGKKLKLFTDKVEHSGMLGVQLIHDVPRPLRAEKQKK